MQSARVACPLTLTVAVPEEICATSSRHDVLAKLLSVLKADEITCIQFLPRRYVRVTFKTFAARQAALQSGVTIDSCSLTMFEADPVEVSLEHLPLQVTDDVLREALNSYGTVHGVRFQKHPGSDTLTGTRLVKMSLSSHIPTKFRFLRYSCRVLYRGQPRPCPICHADGHRAYACSLRDKCRRCHKPGHFARNCTSGPVQLPAQPNDDHNGDPQESESDSDESREWNTGDEEVAAAALEPSSESDPPGLPEPAEVPELFPSSEPDPVPENALKNVSESTPKSVPEPLHKKLFSSLDPRPKRRPTRDLPTRRSTACVGTTDFK